MDFHALKNYSHDVKQTFSAERWCLTGDAGVFVDPLYSPGSDFIGIANGFVSDLIDRDLRGESIDDLAEIYDQSYRSLGRTFLVTYHRQYPLMGKPRVMTVKVVWDFVMYWGGRRPPLLSRQAARPRLHGSEPAADAGLRRRQCEDAGLLPG